MRTRAAASETGPARHPLFSTVVVGIDETPESVVAAAQAAALRAPGGRLVLLGVVERHLAAHAGAAAADAEERQVAATRADLERARELVQADEAVIRTGRLVPLLVDECMVRGADLLAVGARPHRRLVALALGGHDVEALRRVPCAVLLARPGWGPHRPERIVAAVEGSPPARHAERVARALAASLGCELIPVVGLDDDPDPELLRTEREDALVEPGTLVEAVARTATRASLVVVGRDPLQGGRAGLEQRIAYAASCSVLVVPSPPEAG